MDNREGDGQQGWLGRQFQAASCSGFCGSRTPLRRPLPPPPTCPVPTRVRPPAMSVILETSKGDLVVDLYVEDTPRAAENFIK